MPENKTLNEGVNQLIHRELQRVNKELEYVQKSIKRSEEELLESHKDAQELARKKEEYEEILRTHDATYTIPEEYKYPTEFKVRE